MPPDDKPNAPMTPREYVQTIVLPTLHEFLCDRAGCRRAYLACLVVYHCADSLALAEAVLQPGFDGLHGRPRRDAVEAATRAVQAEMERRCGHIFRVVRDIANGTKHPARLPLLPGSEVRVPPFTFDTAEVDFDLGRIGTPGLAVRIDDKRVLLDACCQQVLAAYICAYPAHLGGLALAFMDPGLPVPGLHMRTEWLTNISVWAGGKIELAEVWLLGSRADGVARPDSDVDLGVVLAAPEAGTPGNDWARGGWLASHGMWREQLRAGVGGHLDLKVLSRPGEPRSEEEAAARAPAILLWTRAYMTDAKLTSLSTR